jgi:hypothetical protein
VRAAGLKTAAGREGVTVYEPPSGRFGKEKLPETSVVAVALCEPESARATPGCAELLASLTRPLIACRMRVAAKSAVWLAATLEKLRD